MPHLLAQLSVHEMVRAWSDYVVIVTMLLAAGIMFAASKRVAGARTRHATHDSPVFWAFGACVFVLFAAVKSLNMLAFVGVWLRELMRAEGTYDGRRPFQLLAVGTIGVAVVVGGACLASNRGLAKRHWQLLACMGLLAAFAMTRFVSLHEIDALLNGVPWFRSVAELALTVAAVRSALRAGASGRSRKGDVTKPGSTVSAD